MQVIYVSSLIDRAPLFLPSDMLKCEIYRYVFFLCAWRKYETGDFLDLCKGDIRFSFHYSCYQMSKANKAPVTFPHYLVRVN